MSNTDREPIAYEVVIVGNGPAGLSVGACEVTEDEDSDLKFIKNFQNCGHCKTRGIKNPSQNMGDAAGRERTELPEYPTGMSEIATC